jgi:GTPase Era involved in 16S rRNA processing
MSKRSINKTKRRINRIQKIKKSTKKVIVYKKIHHHEFTILATMSSGKSTLINALLGEDLLPNENQACTSKIFKIIDKDGIKKNTIKVIRNNKTEETIEISLNELNKDTTISEVIIEGDFRGIKNKILDNELHQICLVDTPGPNNSLENSHTEIAYKLIEDESDTHLIYVLNGTQIGVTDDKKLLIDILDKQNKMGDKNEITFVLNKMDEIDQETENIEKIIVNVKKYLQDIGINDPKVIPISAYAAKIFKLALNNKLETRKERSDFKKYYSYFKEFKISNLKPSKQSKEKLIKIGGDNFSRNEIIEKLHSTGIIDLEKTLESSLNKRIKSLA